MTDRAPKTGRGLAAPARRALLALAIVAGGGLARAQGPEDAPPAAGPADVGSVLRDRLEDTALSGEAPAFSYPDAHADPAAIYRDRYGATREDADPFLFPRLVNLIFEDRWLLNERDPAKAVRNRMARRLEADIRDPAPDTANFPNSAYTIAKGRVYIENSPLGLYAASPNRLQARVYQWEYLLRYGLTDNLELRIFSNGLTYQARERGQAPIFGYSPLTFDFKANFWEENTRYHIPAMGLEVYLQTTLGSQSLAAGTQPSVNLLFDHSLPLGLDLEYNFGMTGVQNGQGQITYQFSYQWSLQREVVKDFDVFFHGFYNAAALPRLLQFQGGPGLAIPQVTVLGGGGLWTVNDRLAVFGSYNFGITDGAPRTIALMGFAVAL
ncbi:hypothetical protein OJF2_77740 [Aquisphaera giovannonii]|uniref:MetA-pathway of phenol degradation n=1 Tax=Aquisphaera giovannonii TaxID=406548 RepID=A0A5B9WF03_9BACT|nr:transporter [Aquisphaera giovannonii]QEH39162.1 hypothetical protein OJF2_77740 [Aquisphaera giovannonii]